MPAPPAVDLDEGLAALTPPRKHYQSYYVMDRDQDMARQVAADMPSAEQLAACAWWPHRELAVASEYGRTGFQGGLQPYRVGRAPRLSAELLVFAGRTIDVPALFIAGRSDWGVCQRLAASRRWRRPRARTSAALTCLPAPATGFSRSSRSGPQALILEVLRESRA